MVTGDQVAIAKETGRRLGSGGRRYSREARKKRTHLDSKHSSLDEMILDADGFAGVFRGRRGRKGEVGKRWERDRGRDKRGEKEGEENRGEYREDRYRDDREGGGKADGDGDERKEGGSALPTEDEKIQILTLNRLEAWKKEREAKKALGSCGSKTRSVGGGELMGDLLGGMSGESTKTTRKLEKLGDVAPREVPRALDDTLLGKAERAGRNVFEEPRNISMAPVDKRSERRFPSNFNSHPFDSRPSATSFRLLSHVLDIINIGKTWETIRSAYLFRQLANHGNCDAIKKLYDTTRVE